MDKTGCNDKDQFSVIVYRSTNTAVCICGFSRHAAATLHHSVAQDHIWNSTEFDEVTVSVILSDIFPQHTSTFNSAGPVCKQIHSVVKTNNATQQTTMHILYTDMAFCY